MAGFGKLKKATLALAIAAGFAASGAAQAGLVATAVLEVKSFQIRDATTNLILDFSNFVPASIADSATNTARLNAVTVSNGATGIGGVMNALQASVGTAPPVENTFTHTTPPPAAGSQLARADSLLSGAPLTNVPGAITGSGALAQTVAEVLLTGNGNGHGDSGLGLNTVFNLVLTSIKTLRLDFLADHYLRTFLSADSLIPGSSTRASSALSFTVDKVNANGTTTNVFSWAPNGQIGGIFGGIENFDEGNLNDTITTLVPGTTTARDLLGDQHFQADTTLVAGTYQFSINQAVFADGTLRIPEPGSMALVGLGLLGLAAVRRRKASK